MRWVSFNLRDSKRQAALVAQGAHVARDGALVGLHVPEHVTPAVEVNSVKGGGESVPAQLVLVRANGVNLDVIDADGKLHPSVAFSPSDPLVKDVAPVTDLRDLPPGRVVNSRMVQAMHNADKSAAEHVLIPEEIHAGSDGMTPTQMLAHHEG
jgi:hypothetical protein